MLTEFLAINKAMSDASRGRALNLLMCGELCLCEIVQILGLAPSTVSKHMTELYRTGLVDRRKDGRWQYFSLPTRSKSKLVRAAIRALQTLEDDPQLVADRKALRKVKRMKPGERTSCY